MKQGKSTSSRKRAILGGSFDPVHRGHLAMIEVAREAASLDEVILMPCFVSPFKDGTHADAEQRVAMLRLAIVDEKLDWVTVSSHEVERPGPSYSWQTAEHFHEVSPDDEWFWIVGTDQWDVIDRWAEPERLRERLHFLVLTRGGEPVQDREGWRYTGIEFSHPASSTAIRGNFADHTDWLTPSVIDYCRDEGLYSSEEGCVGE